MPTVEVPKAWAEERLADSRHVAALEIPRTGQLDILPRRTVELKDQIGGVGFGGGLVAGVNCR